jgi:hypothetical protein
MSRFIVHVRPAFIHAGLLLALASCLLLTACSGAKSKSDTDSQPQAAVLTGHSEINITYTLGHAHRKFEVAGEDGKIHGVTYVDRSLLKESSIDPAKYQAFFQRVSDFVEKGRVPAQNAPKDDAECRNPYSITLVQQKDTKTIKGCRESDEGTFGKLIRDGEFLLFGHN